MSLARTLKTMARQEPLSERAARDVTAAVLDGGVPEVELGALLALCDKGPRDVQELAGCVMAVRERCFRIAARMQTARPVVLASHNGVSGGPNLLPLLAFTLQRLGLPVLIHGVLSAPGCTVAAQVLRELGMIPCVTLGQAQRELDASGIAFAPTAVLAPGVADLLALRGRLGFGAYAERLSSLLDPFGGDALLVVGASDAHERQTLRALLTGSAGAFLLLEAEGDAFADPQRRPALELVRNGTHELLFTAEVAPQRCGTSLPSSADPRATAAWTRSVLNGQTPIPLPIVNQVACCLYGASYTVDINQAKAIAAVQTGSLAAA